MRKVEWLKDENGELYVGAGGHTKLYANGIVSARYALNEKAYKKLEVKANATDKKIGSVML